ncbi:hypothetical protein [Carboxylicivirga sp. N1Y90]|uniref:hypothetical protein n=1 Tax=Carboxylicivirga fragile TaxID=3417571 RepID=UPI003D335B5E|nr:hypothetical protein [Marinilabiliaceae bacterium N1Y90]
MITLDKKQKWIVSILLIPILIYVYIDGFSDYVKERDELYKKYPSISRTDNIACIINEINEDKSSALIIDDQNNHFRIDIYVRASHLCDFAQIGDSLSKKINSNILCLHKKYDDKVQKFEMLFHEP